MDREEIRAQRDQKVARFLKFFGVIMAIFYLVAGIAFFFFPLVENLTETMRYMICILLVSYGIYRFYRAIKS